jgi:hypothetical protein
MESAHREYLASRESGAAAEAAGEAVESGEGAAGDVHSTQDIDLVALRTVAAAVRVPLLRPYNLRGSREPNFRI